MSLPPPESTPYTTASLLQRFAGALIDAILIGFAAGVVYVATGSAFLGQLFAVILGFVYSWLLIARDGQTIGKRVADTRVVMVGPGTRPGSGAAFVRASVAQLPGLLPVVGLLYAVVYIGMIVFTEDHRGPHDLAAGTIVVQA